MSPRPLWQRLLIGLGGPAVVFLACLYAYLGLDLLHCPFYELTGFYCPGCGSGRAVRLLLHGQLRAALSCNYLLFIIGIPCVCILIYEYLRIVFPRLGLRPVLLPQPVVFGCTALLIAYWILRNLPLFSFLAPAV